MSTYTWRNRLLLDLPMRMAQHDPVGGLSVNVGRGGAALNAVFGAGAAVPTKLGYRRGYGFDGADDMQCSAAYALTTGLVSVVATMAGPPLTDQDYVFSWESPGVDSVAQLRTTDTQVRFGAGGLAAANFAQALRANFAIGPNQVWTACGVYDGTNTIIYINGEWVVNAATPVAPSATARAIAIGERIAGGNNWTGNIYHVGMADFAVTPIQVKQYHREMMKRLHQI